MANQAHTLFGLGFQLVVQSISRSIEYFLSSFNLTTISIFLIVFTLQPSVEGFPITFDLLALPGLHRIQAFHQPRMWSEGINTHCFHVAPVYAVALLFKVLHLIISSSNLCLGFLSSVLQMSRHIDERFRPDIARPLTPRGRLGAVSSP